MKLKDLGIRALFAVWSIPLGWIIVNSTFDILKILPFAIPSDIRPFYPVHILNISLILLALKEYNSMLSQEYTSNKFSLSFLWIIPALVSSFIPGRILPFKALLFLLLVLVSAEAFFVGKGTGRWKRASLMFSGTIFLYLAGTALLEITDGAFTSLWRWSFPDGGFMSNIGYVFVLASVFMSDTCAYFAGSIFGKHHFSSLSPKKTVEGAVGGLLASIITMTVGIAFFGKTDVSIWFGVLLGFFIGIAAQVGDLLVSSMKRYFDVKDTSQLIPGHGGILDRFDSVFFAVPVVQILVLLFNQVR